MPLLEGTAVNAGGTADMMFIFVPECRKLYSGTFLVCRISRVRSEVAEEPCMHERSRN